MPKLLLHVCCASCGIIPIELLKNKFSLTLFWYNPNIEPKEEYERRLVDVKKLAEIYQLPLIVDDYDNKEWREAVKGLEQEPENGHRCDACFKFRLNRTASIAHKNNFGPLRQLANGGFATTLGLSRFKNTTLIDEFGQVLAKEKGIKYYRFQADKNLTTQRERELSKKYNFYRQKYCGCSFANTIQSFPKFTK
ncbi:MAG: epoxyqueuosine reductase QueH [Patescibacteria group bacterium]|nr:epoxyqueuosine reductase QueH [Patescibacteria group bacterium]MDD5121093.1 epoxyqueuosine reductase QueH [Patescibacteria group bacterium]MDD5395988.1 epoxyqueuosine reductase QueH [Patescibacteria group bacterium]